MLMNNAGVKRKYLYFFYIIFNKNKINTAMFL